MGESTKMVRGLVKNGQVVLEPGATLPEGAVVKVEVEYLDFTPEERAEFEAWERLSDEAWAMIDWGDGEIARDSG